MIRRIRLWPLRRRQPAVHIKDLAKWEQHAEAIFGSLVMNYRNQRAVETLTQTEMVEAIIEAHLTIDRRVLATLLAYAIMRQAESTEPIPGGPK